MVDIVDCKFPWIIKLSGINLAIKDSRTKSSDPFYVIHRVGFDVPNKDPSGHPLETRTYNGQQNMKHAAYESEVINQNLNPLWSAHVLETGCEGIFDLDSKFLIDVWDYDAMKRNDFVGYKEFTLRELLHHSISRVPIALNPPPLPHKQNAGKLLVEVVRPGFPQVQVGMSKVEKSMWSSGTSSIQNKTSFALKVYLFENSAGGDVPELGSVAKIEKSPLQANAAKKGEVSTLAAKADDLHKVAHVVVTNRHDVVVASCSVAPPAGTDNLTLTISLPDELEGAPLALHREVLVERLNAAYSRGTNVLALAINGPGYRRVQAHRDEFARCRKASEELSAFVQYLAVGEGEVASPSSFKDALVTQLRILADEIIMLSDPLSKQSLTASNIKISNDKEIHNDRIERYVLKIQTMMDAIGAFSADADLVPLKNDVEEAITKTLNDYYVEGKRALEQDRFSSAATQISQLVIARDKDVLGVAKLSGNQVGNNLEELEKLVKQGMENVQIRCCQLVSNDERGITDEDAEMLRGMLQALVDAEGAVWLGTLKAQDLAKSTLEAVMKAVEAHHSRTEAACTELLKSDKAKDLAVKLEELFRIGSVLEFIPSSSSKKLLETLNEYIRTNFAAQEKRSEFRAALGAFDKAKLKDLIDQIFVHGSSDSIRSSCAKDIRLSLRMAHEKTQVRFTERPLRIKFDDVFVKSWDCFDELSRFAALSSSSEFDALDGLPVDRSPADEIKDSAVALRESLEKAEMEAKTHILASLGAVPSSGGLFAEATDALTFLLDMVILRENSKKLSSNPAEPFCGRIGGVFVQTVEILDKECKDQEKILEDLLAPEVRLADFDLQAVARVLDSLQVGVNLLDHAKALERDHHDLVSSVLDQDLSSKLSDGLSRDTISTMLKRFLNSIFEDAPDLTESIPPSSRETKFRSLGKRVRAAVNLGHLSDFFEESEEDKRYFGKLYATGPTGSKECVWLKKVEVAICDLVVELDISTDNLHTADLSDSVKAPAVSFLISDVAPKLQSIDNLCDNLKYVRMLVAPYMPRTVTQLQAHDDAAKFRGRMIKLATYVKGLTPKDLEDAARTLIYMHIQATYVLLTADEGKALINGALESFKEKNSGQAVLKLGIKLRESDMQPLGEQVVQSYDSFKANVIEAFNTKTQQQNIEYVLRDMKVFGGTGAVLDAVDKTGLNLVFENVMAVYNEKIKTSAEKGFSDECTSNLIEETKTLAEDMKIKQAKIAGANGVAWGTGVGENVPKLLGQILALWTLQQAERFLRSLDPNSKSSYLCRPHPVQIVAMLCLLGLGPPKQALEGVIEPCLVEVRTGEGKTLVMGVTACLLALLGMEVSCACYSEYLSTRDHQSMIPLFSVLDVESSLVSSGGMRVSYCTLVKLCEGEINKRCNIREKVKDLILGSSTGGSSAVAAAAAASRPRRVLLVDEVDVFFSEEFYGRPYRPGCDITSPEIVELIKAIWSRRSENPSPGEVKTWDVYKSLSARFGDWGFLSEAAMGQMLADLRTFGGHQYEVFDGRIGYKEQDTVVFNVRFGYKTMFAYLKEHVAGKITTEVMERNLHILVNCGTFLFAKFPSKFDLVSGVTGTLSTLGEDEKRVIRSDYNISNFYCMPSAYGGSRLKDNGITVTGKDTHFQEIVSQIEENIQGRAVLVFFENFQLLDKFWQSAELKECLDKVHVNFKDLNLLVEETPPANKQQIVSSRATTANALTLATKPFGRGTDFVSMDARVNDKGGIHVVQTFLSESESEEVQIRGRTARQGDLGSYILSLESESLTRQYQVPAEDIATLMLPTTVCDVKAALLQTHRSRLFAGKFDSMRAFVEANVIEDTNAWAFVEDLASGREMNVKTQLQRFNVPVRTTRILIVVDATGSMQGMMDQLKANLRTVVSRAKEVIDDKMKESPSAHFEMQVAAYRNYGSGKDMILEHSRWVSDPGELLDFLQVLRAKGGEGNEAVEIGLLHATRQQDLRHVILIGDMPANLKDEVLKKRKGNGYNATGYDPTVSDAHWVGTPFEEVTTYDKEAAKLKEMEVPVDTYYINNRQPLVDNFKEIARLTGGESKYLDVNSEGCAKLLTDSVSITILKQVGGKELGQALVDAYSRQYL